MQQREIAEAIKEAAELKKRKNEIAVEKEAAARKKRKEAAEAIMETC
jgi:hypothetical protein